MSRAKVKIGDSEIDVEGEETFIKAELDRFQQMLTVVPARRVLMDITSNQNEEENANAEPAPAARTRKVTKKSGPSCADRVLALKGNQFFAQPKTAREISAKLKELATPYAANQLAATMTSLTKRGQLRRYEEEGAFRYVNP